VARASRAFLGRTVRHLAGSGGVRQFLDIGTGLPTANNTHEVAQRVAPESRIVYVDNDPIVLTHARALLQGSPQGVTAYLDADLYQPGLILEQARTHLDFERPDRVDAVGDPGACPGLGQAKAIVADLLHALPSGSTWSLAIPRT